MYRKFLVMAVFVAAAVAAVGINTKATNAAPPPPIANAGGPYAGVAGQFITMTAAASTGQNLSFVWTFGDGASAVGPVVQHAYSAVGTFTVTVVAQDPFGQNSSAQTTASISGNTVGVGFVDVGSNCVNTFFGVQCFPVVQSTAFNPFVNTCGFFGFLNTGCFFLSPFTGTVLVNPVPGSVVCPTLRWTQDCRRFIVP
jgi:PKD repeat protein